MASWFSVDMLVLLANNRCVIFVVCFPFLYSLAMGGVQMGALWWKLRIAFLANTAMASIRNVLLWLDCQVVYKRKRCYIETSSFYFGVQICVHFPKNMWSKLYLAYSWCRFCPLFWNLLGVFVLFELVDSRQSVKHLNPFKRSRWK